MKSGLKMVTRSVVGILIGYLVFVLGAWLVQEPLLGGVSYADSLGVLAAAAILTPASAVIGAMTTVAIAGHRPYHHIVPMCLLIIIETTYLYRTGRVDGPLWFESAAGGSLVIGAIVGAWLWSRWEKRKAGMNALTKNELLS